MSASERKSANHAGDVPHEYFWGCELTTDKPAVTWSFEEEDGDTDYLSHTLFLKHAVLGATAVEDERNLVQVETKNFDGDSVLNPLFSLTLGRTDSMFLDISFGDNIPVTFRLIKGSGPVHLSALHLTEPPSDDGMDELYHTEVNTEDEEESPMKVAKKRKAAALKSTKSKKGRLDASIGDGSEDESMDDEDEDIDDEEDDDDDDDDDDEEEDEEEEESPPKKSKAKPKAANKAKANGAKAKKAAKSANGKAAKKGKKGKA